MMAFYSRHTSHFKAGLLAVLAVLYFVYFGYAVSREFGDEGSVRLVWITCLVVVILALKHIRRWLCPRLQLTSSPHPVNYIHQHHRQINWFVSWLFTLSQSSSSSSSSLLWRCLGMQQQLLQQLLPLLCCFCKRRVMFTILQSAILVVLQPNYTVLCYNRCITRHHNCASVLVVLSLRQSQVVVRSDKLIHSESKNTHADF